MKWETIKHFRPGQEPFDAVAPVIVSASRRCDIPAFQSKQFLEDLDRGYTVVGNPFSGKPGYISFAKTRLFVFWTKNPKPFFRVIETMQERQINFYFQFTLNDYEKEGYEKGLPALPERIRTFTCLSEMIGAERVIWRFDPLLITDRLSLPELLERIGNIASQMAGYTRQLVFSFADIEGYRKVGQNLKKLGIDHVNFDEAKMVEASRFMADLGKKYNFKVSTCSEEIDLSDLGISHNRCIDDRLIARLFPYDRELMDFIFGNYPVGDNNLNYPKIRDRGQRKCCGCILSKDIGVYGDCRYGCVYCYAK